MKILVIGASGLVGSHVYDEAKQRGHEVIGTYRSFPVEGLTQLDLADEKATAELMARFRPDWVVHAAGWTWVDGCEKDPERAFRENCEQPAFLARLCRDQGARFAYFSTTYIFDGTKGPYSEEDTPNPINVYGKSKWAAELKIQGILGGAALIPRVICVWGREAQQKNFMYQVIKALCEGRTMKVPSDQIGNPTWAGDIAWWLLQLMQSGERGVWNLAGEDTNCTRESWFLEIQKGAACFGITWRASPSPFESVLTDKFPQIARRPLHAGAIVAKIQGRCVRATRRPSCIELGE